MASPYALPHGRPGLSVQVPPPSTSRSRTSTKRGWLSKFSSFLLRLRPGPRSTGSSSSSSSSTTPTTTSSFAFSRTPSGLTAAWVNQRVPVASAVSLPPAHAFPTTQHPHPAERARHASLQPYAYVSAAPTYVYAPAPQPVLVYSIPPGPTALSPSPYMLGRAASASAATISPGHPQPSNERGRRRGASISHLHAVHGPAPYGPVTMRAEQGQSAPPVSRRAQLQRTPPGPGSIAQPPSFYTPPPPPPPPPRARTAYLQQHGWGASTSPDSSPSTVRRDSFDNSSAWPTPESQPGRRLSSATHVSGGTFGV